MERPTIGPSAPSRMDGVGAFLPVLMALLLGACSNPDAARASADRFVDRYYVEIDLPKAREETTGFARAKIEREMHLLEGIEGPESDAKPSVYYRFLSDQAGASDDNRGFLYELTINLSGGTKITRRAMVTVREEGGVWRAANFVELD